MKVAEKIVYMLSAVCGGVAFLPTSLKRFFGGMQLLSNRFFKSTPQKIFENLHCNSIKVSFNILSNKIPNDNILISSYGTIDFLSSQKPL